MVILETKGTQKIEKQGEPRFRGQSTAKSMRGWINGMISKYSKSGNTEYEFVFREISNAYNKFHPLKEIDVQVDKWKGKSSFEIIQGLDKITIIKYQKPERGSEPKEIRTEASREELTALINSILRLRDFQPIKTETLSMLFSETLNLGHDGWNTGEKQFFSDRHWHNKFTLMLGALDKLELIEYKGGKTTIKDKTISVQTILNK